MSDPKPLSREPRRLASMHRASVAAAVLLLALPSAMSQDAVPAETETDSATEPVSTFTVPKSLNEGRDPFNPNSTRFITIKPIVKEDAPGPVKLELKGLSGTPERPLAIINNRTLAIGEEQDVTTPQGKVRVKCLDIDGTKVRIYAQGQMQELMLRKGI